MSKQAAEHATAYSLKHGLEVYLKDAAQLFAAAQNTSSGNSSDANSFMAHYLTAVVCGQHLPWRHYGLVSGTHFNRQCFLVTARRSLAPLAAAGRLSFCDIHSMLQLLCPDFPTSVLKNAWSSAVAVQEWVDYQRNKQQQGQQQQHTCANLQPQQTADAQCPVDLVQFAVLWQCLEVTFLFEHCLLLIRREAFDRDKKCNGMQQLESAIQHAASLMPRHGWPVPSERCWKVAVGQASRAATTPDFAFKDLVRALCCCQALVQAVRQELQDTAGAAANTAAALAAALSSRQPSNTDDATG